MRIHLHKSFVNQILKIALLVISLNLTAAYAQTERRPPQALNVQTADGLIEQIQSIVNSCQNKAIQIADMRETSYQSKYELELARRRLENVNAGGSGRLMDIDYMFARDEASKSVEANTKAANESIFKCKETAKSGMDQEVKNLVSMFSSRGMSKEIKSFVAAWYTSLQSVGTEQFKEQKARMDSMAENLKLEVALRSNGQPTSKGK